MTGKIPLLLLPAGLVVFLAAGATPTGAPASRPSGSWDSYRLVVTRNIFARDRSARSRVRPVFSQPTTTYGSGQQELVLFGVVVQDGLRLGLFEDTQTHQTVRVPAGQVVGRGTVVSVSLDGVEYRSGGATRNIAIGESLSGLPAAPRASAPTSLPAGSATSGTATGPGEPADKGASDILERMRQRRAQELRP